MQVASPPSVHDQEHLAASFEQERAYVLERLSPGSAALNAHRAVFLSGAVSEEAVRRALGRIMARHEILRSSLGDAPGGLVQAVHDRLAPDFTFEDLSSVEAARADVVHELAASFVER